MATAPVSRRVSYPNARRKGLSGWQRTNLKLNQLPIMPASPTRWSLYLYKLGIAETEILEKLKSGQAKMVVDWIRRNHDCCYVPVEALEIIGCHTRWD